MTRTARARLPRGTASLGLFALLALGCSAPPAPRASTAPTFDTGDPRVGVYVSTPRTFSTNSFWIEGPDGLILIDTQFLPSEALRTVERAERETGKRVVLAVVLHANPDKFNGTRALQDRGVRVITSDQVRALIPEVHALRHGWFASRYRPDYPDEAPIPDAFGSETTTLGAAGTEITLHVLGAGCSEAHVVVEWQGHAFVGDLVANRSHSWLELGLTSEWLARLDEISALAPRFVHPGRGASGGPELIGQERDYLTTVAEMARTSDGEVDELRAQIEARYPGYGFPVFLRVGLPAVLRSVRDGD